MNINKSLAITAASSILVGLLAGCGGESSSGTSATAPTSSAGKTSCSGAAGGQKTSCNGGASGQKTSCNGGGATGH